MLEKVFERADDYDILHFHCDYMHYPLSRCRKIRNVTTLHGRLDLPDLIPLYREFTDMPVVSISNAQRKPLPSVNWQGTVYHGLPRDLYQFHPEPGKYLAFLGRTSPEKGADRAIEIAKQVGMELRLAAKVDHVDEKYFKERIEPLLDHPLIHFENEIAEAQKNEFLGNALALLVPIDWPEPFGMVMIEAMACGTPVIAFRRGSVPEVIDEGRSGRIVENVEEAVVAIQNLDGSMRRSCREAFEDRFIASRMTEGYLKIYERLGRHRDPQNMANTQSRAASQERSS
jgi:glycosyltransferase involved in cell wall biosynthesis